MADGAMTCAGFFGCGGLAVETLIAGALITAIGLYAMYRVSTSDVEVEDRGGYSPNPFMWQPPRRESDSEEGE